ncbi:MAG TPA: aspartate aminotransferase family protein [Thermodesulfovibrionales bacterium]|nr:aspartate aminotransferase family protein [Thermodesulfovibrionales bacterium]
MPLDLREIIERHQGEQLSLLSQYINPQMAKVLKTIGFDPVYVRGKGSHLWDDRGNDYLDMISGFGVFALGRSHPKVKEAIRQYLDLDSPNLVKMGTQLLAGLLAQKLVNEFAPPGLDTVFFCNSGAEAVDGALKFAHAFTGRKRFLYCDHGFHGLTLGTLAISGCKEFRADYEELLSGGTEMPFGDIAQLERELSRGDVAALVVEPVIGHGVFIPPDDFLPRARELCTRYGTLLIADEVQTGFGRTGKLFACEHWNVVPDIMTLSKSLSGGYCPIGAILYPRKIYDKVFSSMDRCMVHSTTFSQNDLAAVCGLATLEVLREEHLVENSARMGTYLVEQLRVLAQKYELIREVRGLGLMIAVEFGQPSSLSLKTGWKMIHQINKDLFCQSILVPLIMDHHIIAQVSGHGRDIIKLIPPLVFNQNDADRFIEAFDQVLAAAHRFPGPIWEVGSRIAKAVLR